LQPTRRAERASREAGALAQIAESPRSTRLASLGGGIKECILLRASVPRACASAMLDSSKSSNREPLMPKEDGDAKPNAWTEAVAGAQKNIAETLEALNLKFDWAVVTDFAKEQAAVAMVEAQRIASGDTTHLLKASCTAGAVCSSVVGLLGVINPFNIFMPMRYLMDVYLAAFSLVALAFEFPHPRTAPVRKWVEKWMRALSRLTGRGVFYIFLGSLSFAQLWESGGLGYFFAFLMGGIEVFAGCLCVYEGVQTSVKMAKAREALGGDGRGEGGKSEEARVRAAFTKYDANKSGTMEAAELVTLCNDLGVQIDDAQAEHALNMMDADREGTVNVDDFLAWWASAKHGEHMLV
jgi:hypothetical protein